LQFHGDVVALDGGDRPHNVSRVAMRENNGGSNEDR